MRNIYYRRFLCLGITMITAVMNSVGNLTQTGQGGRCIFQLLYNFDRAFLINPASVISVLNQQRDSSPLLRFFHRFYAKRNPRELTIARLDTPAQHQDLS